MDALNTRSKPLTLFCPLSPSNSVTFPSHHSHLANMSLSEKSTRGSKTPTTSTPAPPGDHRKRRRNRTTQSCLNCHASKRMVHQITLSTLPRQLNMTFMQCDRRRPACQRCTTLGLVCNIGIVDVLFMLTIF